ncbi:PAS domain-containing protein [Cysteiniphilum sp. 6C5]|uniref:PAS domain-containing sensor histidine kinase n=1 Tax=unclassified Cysteiniphilum TaxID=2610889 RepID=UPI003F86E1A6
MHLTSRKDLTSSFNEFSEIVPGGFYWFDVNHKLMGANSFILKTAGMKLEDILGKTPIEMHPESMGAEIIAHHKEVIKTGQKVFCEEKIVNPKSGQSVHFDVVLSPLFDGNNEIFGVCGISTDITERKRLEEETVRQKNQLEKKLQFQKGYLKSFGYDAVNSLKTISDAIDKIEKRLMQLDVPHKVRDDLNDEFYDMNESLSQMYTIYQEINSTVIAEEEKIKDFDKKHEIPTHLENLVEAEMDIANGSISAEFDVEATFEMDDTSKQKVNVDYKKLQHILRTLLANYTKAIDKDSRKEDIHLKITAKDGAHDKLYVTFNFAGNIPFLELEEDNIRAEHLMYKNQTHIAMDKHNFAYDLALARHYADVLCEGEDEDLNESLFESPRFSFTLPFQKATGDGTEKKFKPTLVE